MSLTQLTRRSTDHSSRINLLLIRKPSGSVTTDRVTTTVISPETGVLSCFLQYRRLTNVSESRYSSPPTNPNLSMKIPTDLFPTLIRGTRSTPGLLLSGGRWKT